MNIMTIDLPVTLNQTYHTTRQGGFYKATKAKTWQEKAGWQINTQNTSKCLMGRCYVGITMYLVRDRDIDSSVKAILDLLQEQRVYENDRQVVHLNIRKYHVKKGNERCEIVVAPTEL